MELSPDEPIVLDIRQAIFMLRDAERMQQHADREEQTVLREVETRADPPAKPERRSNSYRLFGFFRDVPFVIKVTLWSELERIWVYLVIMQD
jgi:hypothetical protein